MTLPLFTQANIQPKFVRMRTVDSFEELMSEIGRRSMLGYAGEPFFGSAFVQGGRLQFTTAMPVEKMLKISHIDRSVKKDNVTEVMAHSNRPAEPQHGRALLRYLQGTACAGTKFILPNFMFNYGVGLSDDDPKALLIVYAGGEDGNNAWPAIFLLPTEAKLDITDGAHRRHQAELILNNVKHATPEQRDAFRQNAVGVTIIFEDSRVAAHQDFADCGRAKPIPAAMVKTFDTRDDTSRRAREIVQAVPFLEHYVDATAAGMNITGNSKRIWSLSAVFGFVAHVVKIEAEENSPDPERKLKVDEWTVGAEKFFEALIQHMPQYKALDAVRTQPDPNCTTAKQRERRGGDVALRALGMYVFARAFLHCRKHGVAFDDMAKKLATIDWCALRCERGMLPTATDDDPHVFAQAVQANANSLWFHVLVVRGNRFRISSSMRDADRAWLKILDQIFPQPVAQAAE